MHSPVTSPGGKERAEMTKYEMLVKAYDEGDYAAIRDLMDGYSPAQMRMAYRLIEEREGYAAKCAAKRGEHTYTGHKLGLA
jgi:predicted lipid-binding transport protein (Tim44 family)